MTTRERLAKAIHEGHIAWLDIMRIAERLGFDAIDEAVRYLEELPANGMEEAAELLEARKAEHQREVKRCRGGRPKAVA